MPQIELERHLRLDLAAVKSSNLCDRFTTQDLSRISEVVWEGYQKDLQSRQKWFDRTEAAMDLAMQLSEEKTFPWPNASNIVFPLVTIAALQFHARAYPTIVQGTEVVKCRVAGGAAPGDVDRAYRVGCYMSYQVLEEDKSWEEQTDRQLLNYSIVGCNFKKSFFDPKVGHNCSQLVLARDMVVDYYATSIEGARRKTQVVPLYRNEIIERARAGIYRDVTDESWLNAAAQRIPQEGEQRKDAREGKEPPPNTDWAVPYRGLEQHVWLDLDGDNYEEPYIILIEEASRAVLRIVSRVDRIEDVDRDSRGRVAHIRASEYFTKYGFIPSPDGGIYDIGFGVLLGPLNESVNSLINQLVDAGTMANTAGGFLGRGAKIRGGVYTFAPLEWKRVDSTGDDLRKNVLPLPVREPSNVLFQLLGLLIEYTNRVSGATEMLSGENPGQNTKVGTTTQMVEQGLKIYGAIFKRCWRSMKEEFKKLYILNSIHMPVRKFSFTGIQVGREDFLGNPDHIVPAADPNIVSDQMRVQQAMFLADRAMRVAGYDPKAIEKNLLRAMRVDEPDRFYVGVEKTGPLPNIKLQVEKEKTNREQLKLKHQAETAALELQEQHDLNTAKIQELEAQATNLLAQAKGVDVSAQISAINAMVGALREHNAALHERAKVILEAVSHESGNKSGAIQHLVGRPGDQGGSGAAPAMDQQPNAGLGGGGLPS